MKWNTKSALKQAVCLTIFVTMSSQSGALAAQESKVESAQSVIDASTGLSDSNISTDSSVVEYYENKYGELIPMRTDGVAGKGGSKEAPAPKAAPVVRSAPVAVQRTERAAPIVAARKEEPKVTSRRDDTPPVKREREETKAPVRTQDTGARPSSEASKIQQQGRPQDTGGRKEAPARTDLKQQGRQQQVVPVVVPVQAKAGINGNYAHRDLSKEISSGGAKQLNKNTFELPGNKPGEKIRVVKDPVTGQSRVSSKVMETRDANNRPVVTQAKYSADGRKSGTSVKGQDAAGRPYERKATVSKTGQVRSSYTGVDSSGRKQTVSYRGNNSGRIERDLGGGRTSRVVIQNNTYVTRNYYSDPWGYHSYSPSYHFASAFMTGFILGSLISYSNPYRVPYYSTWGWYPSPWLFNPYPRYNPYSYYFAPSYNLYSPYDYIGNLMLAESLSTYHRNRILELEAERAQIQAQQAQQQSQDTAQSNAELSARVDQLQSEIQQMKQFGSGSNVPQSIARPNSDSGAEVAQTQAYSASSMATARDQVDGLLVKDKLAGQIKEEMVAHNDGKSVTLSDAMKRTGYLFRIQDTDDEIQSQYYDKKTEKQVACSLSPGDIITLARPLKESEAKDKDYMVDVQVANSKHGSCPGAVVLQISLGDLQELKTQFSESVEAQAIEAQKQQGKTLPKAPGNSSAVEQKVDELTSAQKTEYSSMLKGEADVAKKIIQD